MPQGLPLAGIKLVEETSQFNECSIKSYNDEVMKNISLKLTLNILKVNQTFIINALNQKTDFEKRYFFQNCWIMQFLQKSCKMWENIYISNLSPLLKGRNKKIIGLMKNELGGKLTTVWCIETKKADNSNENKNTKSIKKSHKKKSNLKIINII